MWSLVLQFHLYLSVFFSGTCSRVGNSESLHFYKCHVPTMGWLMKKGILHVIESSCILSSERKSTSQFCVQKRLSPFDIQSSKGLSLLWPLFFLWSLLWYKHRSDLPNAPSHSGNVLACALGSKGRCITQLLITLVPQRYLGALLPLITFVHWSVCPCLLGSWVFIDRTDQSSLRDVRLCTPAPYIPETDVSKIDWVFLPLSRD